MEKKEFIELISANKNLIYKVCNSYCFNYEDRKDLEQEILLQIWKSLKNFDGRVKITTWIYKIALNTAISFYRKDIKKIDKAKNDINNLIISLPNDEYNSEIDEKIGILYKLIEQLSKLDKALILLYLDSYKYKEIAEILGITETNVATKLNRIKKSLKEQIINF